MCVCEVHTKLYQFDEAIGRDGVGDRLYEQPFDQVDHVSKGDCRLDHVWERVEGALENGSNGPWSFFFNVDTESWLVLAQAAVARVAELSVMVGM